MKLSIVLLFYESDSFNMDLRKVEVVVLQQATSVGVYQTHCEIYPSRQQCSDYLPTSCVLS